jgi:hypothetical protein
MIKDRNIIYLIQVKECMRPRYIKDNVVFYTFYFFHSITMFVDFTRHLHQYLSRLPSGNDFNQDLGLSGGMPFCDRVQDSGLDDAKKI